MGCFSPPGDERLEKKKKAERHDTKIWSNKVVLGKSSPYEKSLYWFGTLPCSFRGVELGMRGGNDVALYLDLSPWYPSVLVASHRGIRYLSSPAVRDHSLGASANTQHPLRLHLIIFILNYNSTNIDSGVQNSGSRQSRAAWSPPTRPCRGGFPTRTSRQIMFFPASVAK